MKNYLVLFLLILSANVFAQLTRAQLSGNGPTADYKGYMYNFSGNQEDNCSNSSGPEFYYDFNQLSNPNYTVNLNETIGALKISFDGSQSGAIVNHFNIDNCIHIENGTNGLIDISDVNYQFIEAKVRTSVAVSALNFMIVTTDGSFLFIGDGVGIKPLSVNANEWTIVRFPAVFVDANSTSCDPTKCIGFAIAVDNVSAPQPLGYMEVDYVKIGVASKRPNPTGVANSNGNGYQFNFTQDSLFTCFNGMNPSGNSNFNFEVDEVNRVGVLNQLTSGVANDYFAMNFTDATCGFTNLNLSNPADRFIKVKIKSDVDVPSVGFIVAAPNEVTRALEYSYVSTTYSLTANQWTDLNVPIVMKNLMGQQLDSTQIESVIMVVNPQNVTRTSASQGSYALKLSIDNIKIGDAPFVQSGNTTNIVTNLKEEFNFNVFPNPVNGEYVNIKSIKQNVFFEFMVYDMKGNEIMRNEVIGDLGIINTSLLKKGVYLVKINAESYSETQKLVVY